MPSVWKPFRYVSFATLKETVTEFQNDKATTMAGSMAFSFFLALFPFFIFLAALTAFVGRNIGVENMFGQVMGYANQFLPPDVANILDDTLSEVLSGGSAGLLSFGAVAALWATASGVTALMTGLDDAYDVEETRSFIKYRATAIALAIALSLLIVLALVLYAFGGTLGNFLAGFVGLGDQFSLIWNLARWPLITLFVMLALALVYYFAPNIEQRFVFISPGSVLATILWFIATALFSIYLNNFSNYSATYGSIGAVIALMMWLYISSMVLLLGGELNAVIAKKGDPAVQADRERKLSEHERVKQETESLRREVERARQAPPPAPQPRPQPQPAGGFSMSAIPIVASAVVISLLAALATGLRRLFGGPGGPQPTA